MPSLPPSGGAPRRLSVERGNWVLEILRNVNIGHDLVRPLTERIRGTRQITSYLKSNPEHERLARAAQKLMQAPPSNDVRSYSVAGDEWVCHSIPPPPLEPEERENEAEPGLEQRLSEVNARLTALMALHEGLLARLARLEARVTALDLQEPGASGREGRGEAPSADAEVPLFAPSDEESEIGAGAFAEDQASAGQAEPSGRAADAPRASGSGGVLTLPSADELARCIADLVGNVTLECADALELNESTQSHYAARLEAEGGALLGLVVMDLRAAVFLGGTLMMQPPEQLEEQYRAQAPERDSLGASAEICNALAGAINGSQSQFRVSASSLDPFDFASTSWVAAPALRCDLEDSFGGRLSVLAHQAG